MDLEDYLRQFRWSDPGPDLTARVCQAVEAARPPRRRWSWLAAAAVLLAAGLGFWIWRASLSDPGPGLPPHVENPDPAERELAPLAILGGRGKVLPVAPDTRVTIVDAQAGRVRLEQGEVYVELDPAAGQGAEVETPAGTARALGTRFYAHYAAAAPALLAVAVLGGQVEVDNSHGRTTCSPGEIAVAHSDAAPRKHTEAPAGHHHGFCPFVSTLGLVYRPDVQQELGLTPEQKARLQSPGADERRAMCRFFQSLKGLPRQELIRKAQEFGDQLERKVAAVLTATQQQRLRQIGYQQEGYFALLRSEVGSRVGLSPEQRQQIDTILVEFTRTRRALLEKPLPPEQRQRDISSSWKLALEQVEKLLTPQQLQTWTELTGSPFPVSPSF